MTNYYIQSLHIQRLWGIRDINLLFKKDVNIIIGPNASGKTTILNLLRYILTFDLMQLKDIDFEKVEIGFKNFEDNSTRTIVVQTTATGYRFTVSKKSYDIEFDPLLRDVKNLSVSVRMRAKMRWKNTELEQALSEIVKAVWLPVSRRLPIQDDDDTRIQYLNLESVDVRLRDLIGDLKGYRLGLEAKLSMQYKDFEKKVLQEILYSKEYDQIGSFPMDIPKPEDKRQLLSAFQVAGLLDPTMQKRIDEHFSAAEDAINEIKKYANNKIENKTAVDFLFIMPLIRRTKSIIQYARLLEDDRNKLFAPLRKFEEIVNTFLQPKRIEIEDTGDVKIHSPMQQNILPTMLSSGEKQILILLIQALVREDEPVVYVADEPELSLHVKWQENLLKSLTQLTKQIQIIVATHSPDIVGPYNDRVIDLGKM